jgi:large subunit ribosomal protein L13
MPNFVIVVNAAAVKLTGNKEGGKRCHRHTNYPGGVRHRREVSRHPTRIIERRSKLLKNRLGRQLATKLKVYAGPDHPHQAQRPVPLALT